VLLAVYPEHDLLFVHRPLLPRFSASTGRECNFDDALF
jgi:hypothetical protein